MDVSPLFDQQKDQGCEDDVLDEGLFSCERDAVAKTAAGPDLSGQYRISREPGKEDGQCKQQPAKEGKLPSYEQGSTRDDLEGDHKDREQQGVVVERMPAPDLEKFLHLVAQA